MEDYLVITANGPWYELFYNLAFLVTFIILIYEGIKRQYPLLRWLFLLIIIRILFIIGTKVFTFSSEDWKLLFTHFELPVTEDKSLMGGLAFGGIGLIIGYYFSGIHKNITDAFAFVIPVGMSIQRVGCFLTGCCFGKVSNLPWAVQYPANTLPHYHQFNDQLIGYDDFLSLPVHPVQLYEIIGLILVSVLLLYLRHRLKKPGSMFLASFIMAFLVRITIEFFRDPHAHTIGGHMIGILNATQIVLFIIVIILSLILIKREKAEIIVKNQVPSVDLGLKQAFVLMIGFSLISSTLNDWFTFSEMAVITSILVFGFAVIIYRTIHKIYCSPLRWVYLAGLAIPLLLMAQTLPYEQDSDSTKKYTTLKIGVSSGNIDNQQTYSTGEGCDRVSHTEYFEQKYTVASADLEVTGEEAINNLAWHYGVQLMLGNSKEQKMSDRSIKNIPLWGLSPYGSFDFKWIGIGGGVHLGNLGYINERIEVDESGDLNTGTVKTNIYPKLYFRVGPQRWFFVDYHLADNFPSAFPGLRQQIGIGTGFGLTNGTYLRYGSNNGVEKYLSGYIPIENRVVLEPILLWGPSVIDDETNYQFGIGVGYRFGFSE